MLDDEPLALGRARMPLLLLRFLAADGGSRTGIPVGRVLAALWPESDGDNATHAFEMTLLRLRNQLGEHGRRALRVERAHVLLDSALCWTDTAALTALLGEIGDLEPETAGGPMHLQHCAALADRLLVLYRGPFAGEDDDAATLGAFSGRLRAKVAGAARSLGAALCRVDSSARAEALYLGLLEADTLLDSLLAPAVKCLLQSGRRPEARALVEARLRRRTDPMSVHDIAEAEAALLGS